MIIKQAAQAGAEEKDDVLVRVFPHPGKGLTITVKSSVMAMFGESIRETAEKALTALEVENAEVEVSDRGALDCVILSRVQAAACRAAGAGYDWKREDA